MEEVRQGEEGGRETCVCGAYLRDLRQALCQDNSLKTVALYYLDVNLNQLLQSYIIQGPIALSRPNQRGR